MAEPGTCLTVLSEHRKWFLSIESPREGRGKHTFDGNDVCLLSYLNATAT